MSSMREKFKVLEGWKYAYGKKELSVDIKNQSIITVELKYGRSSRKYITFMVDNSLKGEEFKQEVSKAITSHISILSMSNEGYHILTNVRNIKIIVSRYNLGISKCTILGETSVLPIVEELDLTKEICRTIAEYVARHDKYKEIIESLDSPDGYMLLFLIYTKYVSSNALSYGRYIDNPEKFTGFANDNIDDTLWVSRNAFNDFLEFIFGKRMYMKEWVPKLISSTKRQIVQSTHKPGNKIFLKIDKNVLGMIFENPAYIHKYEHILEDNKSQGLQCLIDKIKMYIISR